MKLKFKVKKGIINKSEIYLNNSYVGKEKSNIEYKNALFEQIKRLKIPKINKIEKLEDGWVILGEYINKNNFVFYKTIATKIYTYSFKNFLEKKDVISVENLAIIIHNENKEIEYDNTIIFFVDIVKNQNDNVDLFDIQLRRIESMNWNVLIKNNLEKIEMDLNLIKSNESTSYSKTYIEKLFNNYELIFDNEDYKEDPLKFKEWDAFLNVLKDKFDNKSNENNINNFVASFNNKNYLFSKQDLNLQNSKYNIYNKETNEEMSGEWKNLKANNLVNEIKNKIIENNKKIEEFSSKIKEIEEKIEEKNREIKQKNEKIKELEIDNQKNENLFSKLRKENDELYKKIAIIKEKLNKNNKENENLKKLKNEENKNLFLKLRKENNELYEKIAIIKEKLNKNSKENEILEKRKINLKNEIDNNFSSIKNIKELINNLFDNKKKIQYEKSEEDEFNSKIKNFCNFCSKEKYIHIYELMTPNISKFDDETKKFLIPKIEKEKNINNLTCLCFVDASYGTRAIIKRMQNAFWNVKQGYYKNPFFFLGVRKIGTEISINKSCEIDPEIIKKYQLNEKQKSAVNKAINTNSVFYLQGPPGTGKTQTISAIADWIYKNNLSLVMTSSTHEAIANFFDRLSDNNKTNPNLIAFKFKTTYENKKEKENDEKYSDKNLFKFFKSRMINYVLGDDNSEKTYLDKLRKNYNNFEAKYGKNILDEYKNNLPKAIVLRILKNIKNKEFVSQFYLYGSEDAFMSPLYNRIEMNEINYRLNNHFDKILKIPECNELNNLLNLFFEWIEKSKIELNDIKFDKKDNCFDYLNTINKFINKNIKLEKSTNANLESLLFEIKKKYSNSDDKDESKWLKYILENRLLNVIGTTTSSKNEIIIGNEQINLYSEYPIDYMIIDEISKCSMPEIFYRAILAKKIIFAGDYLQLPPMANLNSDDILNYLVESGFKKNEILGDEIKIEENDNNKIKYKEYIENLYKKSFFTIQINKVKKHFDNNENRPYEFLNESHRFGKEIMDIVNFIYPNDEKLKLPNNNSKKSKLFKLNINGNSLDNPVVLINLKAISKKFKLTHPDFNLQIDELGFDQSGVKMFEYKGNAKSIMSDGTYNQYSAFVVINISKKIINENDLSDNSRIAIITLTKNQKEIVNFYIKNDDFLKEKKNRKKIVVNTIDNFQGREEDIVIVDFIRGDKKIENKVFKPLKNRNIDFLKQKERINVALSRGKEKLIIVGWFEYLKNLEIENKLFNKYYQELNPYAKGVNNSYIEWKEDTDYENK